MKTVILTLAAVALLAVGAVAQPQDQTARRLANKMAVAFFAGMGSLDHRHLLRGPLQVSLQLDEPDTAGGQKEFSSKTFRSFRAMELWLKKNPDNADQARQTGDTIICKRGLCRLHLAENQMAHNHIFLTHIWYGYAKGTIFVRKVRLLYG